MKKRKESYRPHIDSGAQVNLKTRNKDFASGNEFPGQRRNTEELSYKKPSPEVLMVTSFPPRECGIATYSQDLMKAINNKFSSSLTLKICALESDTSHFDYSDEVKYVLNTANTEEYSKLGIRIDNDKDIELVVLQHEFGFFKDKDNVFLAFLHEITKPIIVVFHTVIPKPDNALLSLIRNVSACVSSLVVMTQNSEGILITDYNLPQSKITIIPHGTHLVSHISTSALKKKYGLENRKVLTTFGLLSSGKSIETTLEAMPAIIKQCPDVVFLIVGKTHPEVVKWDGEVYRKSLEAIVEKHALQDHVIFINKYLELPVLLEYLQLTDIYLFATRDPNQAVSGTFVYAMSCACPVISTPIPHAREVITDETGIIFDFGNSQQLANAAIRLLSDDSLRNNFSLNTLHKIVPTAWENSAIAHMNLFSKVCLGKIVPEYNLPAINLSHIKKMTTDKGMIQFSKLNQPDISTGYTLDDNARALVAMCMYYKLTTKKEVVPEIRKYFRFINYCQQSDGSFLNYVDKDGSFPEQNSTVNLEDSNGRAIWALGYAVSLNGILPDDMVSEANIMIEKSKSVLIAMHSTRAMAFIIKGLYYQFKGLKHTDEEDQSFIQPLSVDQSVAWEKESGVIVRIFADRLKGMFRHEHSNKWEWFEPYLTYANSTVPEAMLYAWMLTGDQTYKEIAVTSLDFLLSKIYNKNGIEVISNKKWLKKGEDAEPYGEQPIDVAYTVMTLSAFNDVLRTEGYRDKMDLAFNWFLGHNRLKQIIYNPATGGCYDGLERFNVNLNQGAESTVSYLMARLTMEKYEMFKPVYKTKRERVFP
jgi:glycosyltransferase involved in cell wall biosynthesis